MNQTCSRLGQAQELQTLTLYFLYVLGMTQDLYLQYLSLKTILPFEPGGLTHVLHLAVHLDFRHLTLRPS